MSNKQVITLAHIWAIGIFLLIGFIVAAQQTGNRQPAGQQNRNANANSGGGINSNSGGGMNSNSSQNRNATMPTVSSLSPADQKFVMEAATGGMIEVEMGRLAVQRGSSEDVKQMGQRMIDDHTKANDELKQLASARGIAPPVLDAKSQEKLTKMSELSGAEFDKEYMKQMVKDHEKDVSLFEKQSTRGNDPELKSFAVKTLPTLQDHLHLARNLNEGHGSTDNKNANSNNSNNANSSNSNNANSNNSNNANSNNSNNANSDNSNSGISNRNTNNVNRR